MITTLWILIKISGNYTMQRLLPFLYKSPVFNPVDDVGSPCRVNRALSPVFVVSSIPIFTGILNDNTSL
jgi:hypothetical protein